MGRQMETVKKIKKLKLNPKSKLIIGEGEEGRRKKGRMMGDGWYGSISRKLEPLTFIFTFRPCGM